MNVLMTADAVGGVWTYALELARALGARGHVRVTLATMGARPTPAQRDEAAAVPGLALRESAFRLEWMDEPWEDVARAGDWLLALERSLAPDVVHLNGYAHAALPFRAPTVVVAHSCVCSWWRAVKGEAAPPSWDRYRRAVAGGLAAADAVVAPTRAMLDALQREYDVALDGARVVPNGRDAARFSPSRAKVPLVLAAGRLWDEAKNVAALDAVAPRLAWPVAVAGAERHPVRGGGGGDDDDGGAARTRSVRALGRLGGDELAAWLARAAVYALPARYEPFGLSALEAGLSGCALVLGDLPSLREVWDDAARFVPPDDHDALAAAIDELATDAALRRWFAARARCRAEEFTVRRMANGYLSAYESAGARRRVSRIAYREPRDAPTPDPRSPIPVP